jgi:hypothetical protein
VASAIVSVTLAGPGGGGPPGGAVIHGQQLTVDHVGPWTLQSVAKGSESLASTTSGQLAERYSTFPGNSRPSYIPGTDYVYDDDPANHGGIVPAGGMTIDGYDIPAGTWVVQFRDLSASSVIIEGDCGGTGSTFPGVLFRGCRMRGPFSAPGWFNQNGQSPGGIIWALYCDGGAVTTTAMCESIFESKGVSDADHLYVIRCFLTRATTLVFLRHSGDAAIENWCDEVQDFGDSSKHLNGIGNSGNQTATMWLRNHMVMAQQPGSTQLTDIIQMAADDGPYPGTGFNLDGSQGYQIRDNYLGGAAFVLQLGVDKANTSADVSNIVATGNKVTTSLYANGGSSGLGYKGPTWGVQGNTWSGNTWADGSDAGETIPSSAITPGP